MPSNPSGPRDDLEGRLSASATRVEALEGCAFDAGRLRRMLDEARRSIGGERAGDLAEGLETRLRLAEEDLRGAFFRGPEPASGDLRRSVLEEALGFLERTLSGKAFREMVESAAKRSAEAALGQARRELRDETSKSQLDMETAQREWASLEAALGSLQDRLQALEAAPKGKPAPAVDLAPLSKRIEAIESAPKPVPAPTVDLKPLERRLDALESAPKPVPPPVVDLAPLTQRIERMENAPKPVPTPPVDLAPISRRLDALEAKPQSVAAPAVDLTPITRRLEAIESAPKPPEPADLSSFDRRLSALEARIQALAATPAQVDGVAQRLSRLETALQSLPEPPTAASIAAGLKGEIDALARQAAAQALGPLVQDMAGKLATLPSPADVEAAVLKAGEAMDARLTDRLGALLAQAPSEAPAAAPADPAALSAMVQQAMSEAFPIETIGELIEQKVAKKGEALRNELREIEAELVKAVMKQMDVKPAGSGISMSESQISALIDQKVHQHLLKYVQR